MNIRPREITDATHQPTHEKKEKLRYNEPAASDLPQISASRAIQEAESERRRRFELRSGRGHLKVGVVRGHWFGSQRATDTSP